jgi:hypothetical protein
MSWNIKNWSVRRAHKPVEPSHPLLSSVIVAAKIADFIHRMGANVVGVMEVCRESPRNVGVSGCDALQVALNEAAVHGPTGPLTVKGAHRAPDLSDLGPGEYGPWKYWISANNSATRADRYAVFWVTRHYQYAGRKFDAVDVTECQLAERGPPGDDWTDRAPAQWKTSRANGRDSDKPVRCLLWHAPQPKNHRGAREFILLREHMRNLEGDVDNRVLVSGDFNWNLDRKSIYGALLNADYMAYPGPEGGPGSQGKTRPTSLTGPGRKSERAAAAARMEALVASGRFDEAYMANPYDSIFANTDGLTVERAAGVLIPLEIYHELMADASQTPTPTPAHTAFMGGYQISDHIPIVGTVATAGKGKTSAASPAQPAAPAAPSTPPLTINRAPLSQRPQRAARRRGPR